MKATKFRLKIEHLWGLVALMGIFIFINTHPIRPHDFWWHITIGREIVTTGEIPTTDVYSYTENGQAYPSYQMFWLMEIVLYELYHLGGPAFVILVHSLIITAAYGLMFWICKQTTNSWRFAAAGVLFAAALGLNDWNVRPQGITFLIGSLFLFAIYQYKKEARWYWLLVFPIGMLIWVNSHGTFLIGLALIGLWWLQAIWKAVLRRVRGDRENDIKPVLVTGGVFVITTLICLVNPRGIGIVNYIRTLTTNSVVQNLVTEWAPPTFTTLMGAIFFCSLILCCIILILSPKRPGIYEIASLIIFGLLAIKTSRGIVWFGLVMAPIFAEHLASVINRFTKKRPQVTLSNSGNQLVNISFAVVLLILGVVTLPWFKSYLPLPSAKAGVISSETPVEATAFLLDQHPPGRIFNSMSFGSYLIWEVYPQYQVFVDPRIELYSEKIWMDYLNISNAVGDWKYLLDTYGVNTLILSPVEQPGLIQAAQSSGEWILLYRDNCAYIFGRK